MDWLLSDEGQVYSIRQHGNMTSLKNPPLMPEGFDQKITRVWVPNFEQFETLNVKWIEEWNRTFGYRQ